MSNYRRARTKGGSYFFTVITYRRQKILCNEEVRIALREGIRKVQETHPFVIDAWVFSLIMCTVFGRYLKMMLTLEYVGQ